MDGPSLRLHLPVTLLVLLPGPAGTRIVAPGLGSRRHERLRLLLLAFRRAAVAPLLPPLEDADLRLRLLARLPPARQPLLVARDAAHPEHEGRHVVLERLHHRLERRRRLALVLDLGIA